MFDWQVGGAVTSRGVRALRECGRTILRGMFTLGLLVFLGCDPQEGGKKDPLGMTLLEPPEGKAFLVGNIDWAIDSPVEYAQRLQAYPKAYINFISFPFAVSELRYLDYIVGQVLEQGAGLVMTLEPRQGLDKVTAEEARSLAERLRRYNEMGVPILVRFGHEMNGNWYAWGQQPEAYIRAFRLIAEEVHAIAPGSGMMWGPNYGWEYPWGAGVARPGSRDFELLDTDGDGDLTWRDDPYLPYYPGDDVVDWVCFSLYHWGNEWPWTEHVIPERGKLETQLRGTYNGAGGDHRYLPDFYLEYAEKRNKPLLIKTAAMSVKTWGGAPAAEVKRAWWEQLFAEDLYANNPKLAMVSWLELTKFEKVVHSEVDWPVTFDPQTGAGFRAAFPSWLFFGSYP